jgi:hypothetical protein
MEGSGLGLAPGYEAGVLTTPPQCYDNPVQTYMTACLAVWKWDKSPIQFCL